LTITWGELHGKLNVTGKVPRVLFSDVTVKVALLPEDMPAVVGVTCMLTGAEAETTAEPPLVTPKVMVPLEPPCFLIEREDGLTVHPGQPPEPPPLAGGPGVPLESVLLQSTVLLCVPLPLTTAPDETSIV
jgi:hypothetical protein